jgi:hypothetical protein
MMADMHPLAPAPLIVLALALSGCAEGLFAGWTDGPAQAAAAPVYCYRTLGDVDCYDRPDPQQSE